MYRSYIKDKELFPIEMVDHIRIADELRVSGRKGKEKAFPFVNTGQAPDYTDETGESKQETNGAIRNDSNEGIGQEARNTEGIKLYNDSFEEWDLALRQEMLDKKLKARAEADALLEKMYKAEADARKAGMRGTGQFAAKRNGSICDGKDVLEEILGVTGVGRGTSTGVSKASPDANVSPSSGSTNIRAEHDDEKRGIHFDPVNHHGENYGLNDTTGAAKLPTEIDTLLASYARLKSQGMKRTQHASQTKKLARAMPSLDERQQSPYGSLLDFCDQGSLNLVAPVLEKYTTAFRSRGNLSEHLELSNKHFANPATGYAVEQATVITGVRSAAPLDLAYPKAANKKTAKEKLFFPVSLVTDLKQVLKDLHAVNSHKDRVFVVMHKAHADTKLYHFRSLGDALVRALQLIIDEHPEAFAVRSCPPGGRIPLKSASSTIQSIKEYAKSLPKTSTNDESDNDWLLLSNDISIPKNENITKTTSTDTNDDTWLLLSEDGITVPKDNFLKDDSEDDFLEKKNTPYHSIKRKPNRKEPYVFTGKHKLLPTGLKLTFPVYSFEVVISVKSMEIE